jgi:predicted AlkP superfamily pyrophosphatase or phosphodiesterase
LILSDGMRPDSLAACGNSSPEKTLKESLYTLTARTTMPSVTLPCHMSLFLGVPAERHGILTNTYTPQVRPVRGICEVLRNTGKHCAFFYNWGELRDLARPGSLARSCFVSGHDYTYETANKLVSEAALSHINTGHPDFTFLYLGLTDAAGHASGWMSEEYLRAVSSTWAIIDHMLNNIPENYTVIITSDHGGHGRSHGSDLDEDMLIPLIIRTPDRKTGQIEDAGIIDIAPTAVRILGAEPDGEWEGRYLL